MALRLEESTSEANIVLTYDKTIGGRPMVSLYGTGDLSHHLIEGLFQIIERLSKMSDCCHRAKEYQRKEVLK